MAYPLGTDRDSRRLADSSDAAASRSFHISGGALIVRRRQSDCKFGAQDLLWEGTEYTILKTHISVVDAWKDKSKVMWKPALKTFLGQKSRCAGILKT
jgi:hypothetical protein